MMFDRTVLDTLAADLAHLAPAHELLVAEWHGAVPAAPRGNQGESAFLRTALLQHRANFDLWHAEDRARAPHASDHELAETKRLIDTLNQQRNDLAEQCDALLLDALAPFALPLAEAPLHSESPGLMIDRLSILALKLFHTREEHERADAPAGHRERNAERLLTLREQRDDLAACLVTLWAETCSGTRRFKLYQQLKMYNDPSLNPIVYSAAQP